MPAAVVSAIGAGLSAVKTSFDLSKSLRDLITKPGLNPADIHARLLEIEGLLLDARRSLVDAEEDNRKLQRRIEELERMAEFGKDFKLEEGVYWREGVPYRPVCWDVDRKTVRLGGPTVKPSGFFNSMAWECPLHKTTFGVSVERSQLK